MNEDFGSTIPRMKFIGVRIYAEILTVAGVLTISPTFVLAWMFATAEDRHSLAFGIAVLWWFGLAGSFLAGLSLIAFSGFLKVVMEIEKNTRGTQK